MAEPSRRLAPRAGEQPHRYRPSFDTDIRATFKRVRRELERAAAAKEANK